MLITFFFLLLYSQAEPLAHAVLFYYISAETVFFLILLLLLYTLSYSTETYDNRAQSDIDNSLEFQRAFGIKIFVFICRVSYNETVVRISFSNQCHCTCIVISMLHFINAGPNCWKGNKNYSTNRVIKTINHKQFRVECTITYQLPEPTMHTFTLSEAIPNVILLNLFFF